MTNYEKYRGKCKEFCDQAIIDDPELTLVRGHYYCPITNRKEMHWWTIRVDGIVYDPTKLQFASAGNGDYIPFNGNYECAECGKLVPEEEAEIDGNYVYCSFKCHSNHIGLGDFI